MCQNIWNSSVKNRSRRAISLFSLFLQSLSFFPFSLPPSLSFSLSLSLSLSPPLSLSLSPPLSLSLSLSLALSPSLPSTDLLNQEEHCAFSRYRHNEGEKNLFLYSSSQRL